MSDENPVPDEAISDAEQQCYDLINKDADLRTAIDVIATAYRMHHVAQMAIERIAKDEGLSVEALKVLNAAGAAKAKSTYYSMEALILAIDAQAIPFLKMELNAQQEAKRSQELETRLGDRASATKPAVSVVMEQVTVELERGRVMLAVGDKVNLVKRLAEIMCAFAINNDEAVDNETSPLNVINLSAMETPPQIKQYIGRIMRVPLSKWQHLAVARGKLKTLLYAITAHLPNCVCDVIVVDDGNQLFHSIHGRWPCYDLEDGLRAIRRIATELNAALVCLAPIPEDCPEYADTVKSRLKPHTEFIEV